MIFAVLALCGQDIADNRFFVPMCGSFVNVWGQLYVPMCGGVCVNVWVLAANVWAVIYLLRHDMMTGMIMIKQVFLFVAVIT